MTAMSDTTGAVPTVKPSPAIQFHSRKRPGDQNCSGMSWKAAIVQQNRHGSDSEDSNRDTIPRSSANVSVPSEEAVSVSTRVYVELNQDQSQIDATPQFFFARSDANHHKDEQSIEKNNVAVDSTAATAALGNFNVGKQEREHTTAPSESQSDLQNSPGVTVARTFAGSNSQARLAISGTRFESTPLQSAVTPSDTLSATAATWSSSKVNVLLEKHDRLPTAGFLPGRSMGYTNDSTQAPWSSPSTSSSKMDSPPTPFMENKDREDDGFSVEYSMTSSNTVSPAMPPLYTGDQVDNVTPLILPSLGTPTTVSTAASTADEASVDGNLSPSWERLSLRLDESHGPSIPSSPALHAHTVLRRPDPQNVARRPANDRQGHQQQYHRRSMSWGVPPGRGAVQPIGQHFAHQSLGSHGSNHGHQQAGWGQPGRTANGSNGYGIPHGVQGSVGDAKTHTPQPRVASFRRNESDTNDKLVEHSRYGQDTAQHRSPYGDPRIPYPHSHVQQMNVDGRGGLAYRHHAAGPYGQSRMGQGRSAQQTPPRAQNPRVPGQAAVRMPPSSPGGGGAGSPGGPPGTGSQRSQAEVLKTLLRKKACLYEPETSRAVALMTWLVGRELALAHGYFSRQQLQAGVHSCVAQKIESGTITRTKVNRCMQIILNSCFHYIIPRPDGSEESGEAFRQDFMLSSSDDSGLLVDLGAPWNNLVANRDAILAAALEGDKQKAMSPNSSPRMAATVPEGEGDTKRSVLLCFNENVRSAEDVFRCHNEFIRDTAHASNLHLSVQEWRSFFGKASTATSNTAPDASWRQTVAAQSDASGKMTAIDLGKFRTSWCAKRYEHDHTLCGFAHVEVNGGWLRRNPLETPYRDEMCPSIKHIADKNIESGPFVINSCERGASCPLAHSKEEMLYHPQQYKRHTCPFQSERVLTCKLADVCPHQHQAESMRYQAKRRPSNESRSPQRQSLGRQGSSPKLVAAPQGSPMLYVSPAPPSKFEEHLVLPGLQSLFRRNCAATKVYLLSHDDEGRATCHYTLFGEDGCAVRTDDTIILSRGLPPPVRKE